MGNFLNKLKSAFWRGPSIGDPSPYASPTSGAPDMSSGPMPLIGARRTQGGQHFSGQQMPGYEPTGPVRAAMPDTSMGRFRTMEAEEQPIVQKILAGTEEMPYPGTDPRQRVQSDVPEGSSAVADSGGSVATFLLGLSGQGLSTTEILQRARERGVNPDSVLRELTKPKYRPDPPQQPNNMPFPGIDPRQQMQSSFLPRPRVPYVAGQHIPNEGPAEGTFPDMARMDTTGVSMSQPSMAYNDDIAFANPSPPAVAMQAMLRDTASRPMGMSAAPVDIRRSDTMLDAPVRRPTSRRPSRMQSMAMY